MPRRDSHRPTPSNDGIRLRKLCLSCAALAALAIPLLAPAPARADDQVWEVESGRVIFHFNVPLVRDLGVELAVAAHPVADPGDVTIEEPQWAFPIRPESDFRFRAEHGVAMPGGSVGGSLLLDGSITLRERESGIQSRMSDLEIVQAPWAGSNATTGEDGPPIVLRSRSTGFVFCRLVSSMFDFSPKDKALRVHYLNARLTKEWADSFGRPDLADWVIGMAEVRGGASLVSSTPSANVPYRPVFIGGIKDVSLGALSSLQQAGHIGTIPTGTTALSMATTSCNLGTVDVPWLAPMQTDHPMIHMALYRLLNGRFEQIGISWLKHGFFALSNNQCSSCQNPSDGTFLGVGCSDTYGVSNNQNRDYLGPREEVNPYTGIWNCTGSYFAGGPTHQDCVRRSGSTGLDAVAHRLIVADVDLGNTGAIYYYEACYTIQGDQDLHNNWGSRACTVARNGSSWKFSTPSSGNALVNGPALERWGDLRTTVDVAADDGQALLAVQATDLGGGVYHYEYSLLNMNSDRQIRSFNIPVAGVTGVSNVEFHDSDADPANDWQIAIDPGMIHWSTERYDTNPNAAALEFGYMVNFRFDANAVPADLSASLGLFKPGPGSEVAAATRGPLNSPLAVANPSAGGGPKLVRIHPNPSNRRTGISYELSSPGDVRLGIYDAAGRVVRTLVSDSRAAGVQTAVWDGKAADGRRVSDGVYFVRLQAGAVTVARPLVMTH